MMMRLRIKLATCGRGARPLEMRNNVDGVACG